MADKTFVQLEHRAILAVSGEDKRSFLQGLISNDVNRVTADKGVYAALLTPQGKFLHDMFVIEQGDALLLDVEAARLDELKRKLTMYKLRAKVTIEARPELKVFAAWGCAAEGAGIFADPRLAEAGLRAFLPDAAPLAAAGFAPATIEEWDAFRIRLGLPDGSRDLVVEKSVLLENGFDELQGVDWKKGCYMGQELTARTKYRALIRKRLLPVEVDGPLPEPGTPVLLGETEAGEVRSGRGNLALAVLRLEELAKAEAGEGVLTAGAAKLTPRKPGWVVLPA